MADKIILCVDDEKTILSSVKTQLKKRLGDGFVIETAESAMEALEILEELAEESNDVMLIVSDWLMPGMKGDEFLIEVHKKYPDIINVMLTGQADPSAVSRAKVEANLFKVISKPWGEEDLVNTIKNGLNIS